MTDLTLVLYAKTHESLSENPVGETQSGIVLGSSRPSRTLANLVERHAGPQEVERA